MTHYTTSKGERREIATMPYPYLVSAHAKLLRERDGDERQAEIDAMTAEIDKRDAAHAAAQEAGDGDGEA